jgi:hypothetical protein
MDTHSDDHGYAKPAGSAGTGVTGAGAGEYFFTRSETRTREPGLRV